MVQPPAPAESRSPDAHPKTLTAALVDTRAFDGGAAIETDSDHENPDLSPPCGDVGEP